MQDLTNRSHNSRHGCSFGQIRSTFVCQCLLIFSYNIWLHFSLCVAHEQDSWFQIKCILRKLSQKLSAFSLALELREYKLLVMGDSFQIAQKTHYVVAMDSGRATETAMSLVLAEVHWSR